MAFFAALLTLGWEFRVDVGKCSGCMGGFLQHATAA